MKFGPVIPESTELIYELLVRHSKNWRISQDILDELLQCFHHVKALCVQMIYLGIFCDLSRDVAMATNECWEKVMNVG